MFATVSSEETVRLHQLTKELKTEADVLSRLGKPTYVFEPGMTSTEPIKTTELERYALGRAFATTTTLIRQRLM
jgi:hypothetical protein